MAQISRQTTFTAGAKLAAADLEAEFDELVDALTAAINREVHITYNNSDEPTLKLDNTGSGKPLSILIGGTERVYVKETTGQLASTVPTGTAPLIIASTTEVANLNAASVGGALAANLVKNNENTTWTAPSSYMELRMKSASANDFYMEDTDISGAGTNPGAYFRIRQASQTLTFAQAPDDSTWTSIFRLNASTGVMEHWVNSAWETAATQDYVDEKLTTLSFGGFYEGALATGTKQPRYIVPANIETAKITKVGCVYLSGTLTDDSVITLTHYDSDGVSQATAAVTLLEEQVTGKVVTTDITDMVLAAGDQLGWTVTTASGHAEVTIWAQGTQEVI